MRCREVEEELGALIRHELDGDRAAELHAHLVGCEHCRAAWHPAFAEATVGAETDRLLARAQTAGAALDSRGPPIVHRVFGGLFAVLPRNPSWAWGPLGMVAGVVVTFVLIRPAPEPQAKGASESSTFIVIPSYRAGQSVVLSVPTTGPVLVGRSVDGGPVVPDVATLAETGDGLVVTVAAGAAGTSVALVLVTGTSDWSGAPDAPADAPEWRTWEITHRARRAIYEWTVAP